MGSNKGLRKDQELQDAWRICHGSPQRVSEFLKISTRNVYQRRLNLEKNGVYLQTISANSNDSTPWAVRANAYTPRRNETVKDGWLIVLSDCHYWPNEIPLAHTALLAIIKKLQPKLVIANGDIFDGASISRHDVMGWQKLPTVLEEIETVQKRLGEIRFASPKSRVAYTIGNHCSRMDRRLATEVPQFEGVKGMALQDHLPDWPMSYSVMINEDIDPVFVVHNIKGGIHAPYNNIKSAGCTTITGHLHSQKTEPFSTLLHDWEGIDAGCIADCDSAAFSYRMDRPADWRSGFVAMRFDRDGFRFPAELCRVQRVKGKRRAVFRSEIIAEAKS